MKRKILLILIFIFSANQVDAASLVLESDSNQIKVNSDFQINVFLNSEDESINAIGGNISFPQDLLELKEIREGNSIINFWVEKPKIENGKMSFSGIIPGGYNSKDGLIFSLIFKTKTEGDGIVYLNQIQAYKNDGLGTPINLNFSNISFYIRNYFETQESAEIIDNEKPETFSPEISQDQELFENKYFLVFATQDKGVGVDHYEVCEGSLKNCTVAESPYVLKDQSLEKKVYIKAIDKKGNERIVIVNPLNPLPWYKNYLFYVIIIILIISILLINKLWKKLKKY
ncbi:MAG: hypothetical protein MCSN_0760 [Candidatus Microsyncoccus archaeolyticus]|nr:MAG: hypothetical protein MCSN_0760 [Candidatus Parcubacteria bacterium]